MDQRIPAVERNVKNSIIYSRYPSSGFIYSVYLNLKGLPPLETAVTLTFLKFEGVSVWQKLLPSYKNNCKF